MGALAEAPRTSDAQSWPSILPTPNLSNPTGGLVYMHAGERHPVDTYYKDFGPRLGLSYRLRDKLVLRCGYGLFYNPTAIRHHGRGTVWERRIRCVHELAHHQEQ